MLQARQAQRRAAIFRSAPSESSAAGSASLSSADPSLELPLLDLPLSNAYATAANSLIVQRCSFILMRDSVQQQQLAAAVRLSEQVLRSILGGKYAHAKQWQLLRLRDWCYTADKRYQERIDSLARQLQMWPAQLSAASDIPVQTMLQWVKFLMPIEQRAACDMKFAVWMQRTEHRIATGILRVPTALLSGRHVR